MVLFSYVLLTKKKKICCQWKSCGNSVSKFWVNFNWELLTQQFWVSILITRIIKLHWKQRSPSSHRAKAKTKVLKAKKAELKGWNASTAKKKDVHIIHFPASQHHEGPKKHKYLQSEPKRNKFDHCAIIKVFLNTVSATKKIENNNILVFFVNVKVNKHHNKDCEENLRHWYGQISY